MGETPSYEPDTSIEPTLLEVQAFISGDDTASFYYSATLGPDSEDWGRSGMKLRPTPLHEDERVLFLTDYLNHRNPFTQEVEESASNALVLELTYGLMGDSIVLSPMNTLFYDYMSSCTQAANESTGLDIIEAASIFDRSFGFNPTEITPGYDSEDVQKIRHNLLNLAFSKFVADYGAKDVFDVLGFFRSNITRYCSLDSNDTYYSDNYEFHNESFFGDFLDSLESLGEDDRYSEDYHQIRMQYMVNNLRQKAGKILGWENVDEE